MSAYCVKKSGLCNPIDCCMHGLKPGESPKPKCQACNDTGTIVLPYGPVNAMKPCRCRSPEVTMPVTVKLADVMDTIANVRSTLPAGQSQGAAIMQADIIRHLYERFAK